MGPYLHSRYRHGQLDDIVVVWQFILSSGVSKWVEVYTEAHRGANLVGQSEEVGCYRTASAVQLALSMFRYGGLVCPRLILCAAQALEELEATDPRRLGRLCGRSVCGGRVGLQV